MQGIGVSILFFLAANGNSILHVALSLLQILSIPFYSRAWTDAPYQQGAVALVL